jgi:hypothetical protein
MREQNWTVPTAAAGRRGEMDSRKKGSSYKEKEG